MPQVTVYVRDEDLPKWKAIEKKSEFISNALNAMEAVDRLTESPGMARLTGEVFAREQEKFTPKPPQTGYPCCQSKKRCKHWQWDGGETQWINTLTGEVKDE